jgi:hypothetical protein
MLMFPELLFSQISGRCVVRICKHCCHQTKLEVSSKMGHGEHHLQQQHLKHTCGVSADQVESSPSYVLLVNKSKDKKGPPSPKVVFVKKFIWITI